MSNNSLLYNAAVAGFVAGALDGRDLSQEAVPADYAGIYAAAASFAASVDTAVPADSLISSGGAAINPTTATIQNNELTRTGLMRDLCKSAIAGRYSVTATSAFYAGIAASVAAAYNEACPAGSQGTVFVLT